MNKQDVLPDSQSESWDPEVVAAVVDGHISQIQHQHENHCPDVCQVNAIFTFDSYGISGHPNHKDTFQGMKLVKEKHPKLQIYTLQSYTSSIGGVILKYLGPIHLLRRWLIKIMSDQLQLLHEEGNESTSGNNTVISMTNLRPWRTWLAMSLHQSQWVPIKYWFRKLHILLSDYTYHNKFILM